jgi:hypothetical protein
MAIQVGADGGSGGLFSRYPATPDVIAAAADAMTRTAGDLEALAGDLSQTHDRASGGVSGVLAGPMRAAPGPVKRNAMQVLRATLLGAGCVRYWATGVATHDAGVDALNQEYAAAAATNFGVSSSRGKIATIENPQDAAEAFAMALDAARAAKIAELQRRHSKLVKALDEHAAETAGMLDKGPDDEETVRSLYAVGALPIGAPVAFAKLPMAPPEDTKVPPELTGSPEEIARYVAEHPELTKIWLSILPPEIRQLVGRELAERARHVGKDSDPEEVRAIAEALGALGTDREVAIEFVESMGGADVIQLLVTLGWKSKIRHEVEESQELARALRATVSTATTTMPKAEARAFADRIADAVDPGRYGALDRAVALSFLLRDQHHGTAFLDVIGDRLESMERGGPHPAAYDFWLNNTAPDSGVRYLFEPDAGAESFVDPMASFLSALGNNPEAALEFFEPEHEDEGTYNGVDRATYWIRDRAWGHDDFDGLLAALDAATTGPDLGQPDVGRLVSEAVDHLTNRGIDDFKIGAINPDAARSLAHMMGTYMASVDYANHHPTGLFPDDPGLTSLNGRPDLKALDLKNMPLFEKDELEELFKVGVSNREGFVAMREVVSAYEDKHLASVLAHHDEPGFAGTVGHPGMWQHATDADARLEGLLLKSVGDARIELGANEDQLRKAWIQLGHEQAGKALDALAVLGKAPWLKELAVRGLDLGVDALEKALTNQEAMARSDATEWAEQAVGVRSAEIVHVLHDGDVVSDRDIRDAARAAFEKAPPKTFNSFEDWYDQYFSNPDAFPTPEQVANDPVLADAFSDIATSQHGWDTGEYKENYTDVYVEFFPEGPR